jgi:hypothetical protein
VSCKLNCSEKISDFFIPIREKRYPLETNTKLVEEILIEGEKSARAKAQETMFEVRNKMKFG